jgi:phosphatidylserine/phosphatidylglycerophosphate/cardiolipin synthase-like enzyme
LRIVSPVHTHHECTRLSLIGDATANAQHFIYIENQYFISVQNQIANALVDRIDRAIKV